MWLGNLQEANELVKISISMSKLVLLWIAQYLGGIEHNEKNSI